MDKSIEAHVEALRKAVAKLDLEVGVGTVGSARRKRDLGRISLESFMNVVSLKRYELLKALCRSGPLSGRALAKELKRSTKSVEDDLEIILQAGLIDRTDSGLVEVTWDQVTAKLDLMAA